MFRQFQHQHDADYDDNDDEGDDNNDNDDGGNNGDNDDYDGDDDENDDDDEVDFYDEDDDDECDDDDEDDDGDYDELTHLVGHPAGEPGLVPLGHGGVGGAPLNVLPGGDGQDGRHEEREEHVERDLHAGDETERRDCATLCFRENSCSVHVAGSGVAPELR